jgi:aminoglycoside 6'-N-acetyltransferase
MRFDGEIQHASTSARNFIPVTPVDAIDSGSPEPEQAPELMTVLRGSRIQLRPVTQADLPVLLGILREPAVARHWSVPDDDFDRHELLAGDDADGAEAITTFAIVLGERIIGWIAGWEKLPLDYRHAGIDLFLSGEQQGKGFGPEAIRLVCRFLFEERGHHRITIDPAADNLTAIRAYEKVGFRRVGVMRRYERGADGTYHDGLLLDLLPEDLIA